MAARIMLGLALLGGAGAAAAQDAGRGGEGNAALSPLFACRAVAEPAARLACFDKASATLDTQLRERQVRVVDRQDIRKAKRSLFGFTLPRIDLFGGGRDDDPEEKREEFTELNTTIVSAMQVANNRVQFTVAEGDAVWVTTDPAFPPRAGSKVRIRKGALGNYFISVAGERSVRGMRIR